MLENYGILMWIIIGGLAGGIAKLLMPGRDPGGCIITILLGIAGALVAGSLGQQLGWYDQGEGAGFFGAIVGAFILLLLLYRMIAAAAAESRRLFIVGPLRRCNDRRIDGVPKEYDDEEQLLLAGALLCAAAVRRARRGAAIDHQPDHRRHPARYQRDRRSHPGSRHRDHFRRGRQTRAATADAAIQQAATAWSGSARR